MKKRVNLVSVLFLVILLSGGMLFGAGATAVRQAKLECELATTTEEDSSLVAMHDNFTLGGGPNINESYEQQMVKNGESVAKDFVSVKDLTLDATYDGSESIELKADHEYQVIFDLSEENIDDIHLCQSVFRVDWSPTSTVVSATEDTSVAVILSDGHINLEDNITFYSTERTLQLHPSNPATYVVYDESGDRIGSLPPGVVQGLNGSLLDSYLVFSDHSRQIVYEFRTELADPTVAEIVEATDSSAAQRPHRSGAGPVNPDPYFYGPGESKE